MIRHWISVGGGSVLLALAVAGGLAGCSKSDATTEMPLTTAAPTPASPGAAPEYGTPSGMGFSTGDSAHSDGQGSGLMGYHGTGAMGTSGAISDKHAVPAPPKAATEPVLPAP